MSDAHTKGSPAELQPPGLIGVPAGVCPGEGGVPPSDPPPPPGAEGLTVTRISSEGCGTRDVYRPGAGGYGVEAERESRRGQHDVQVATPFRAMQRDRPSVLARRRPRP